MSCKLLLGVIMHDLRETSVMMLKQMAKTKLSHQTLRKLKKNKTKPRQDHFFTSRPSLEKLAKISQDLSSLASD